MTYTETDLVGTIERLAGADLAALTQPQRDQFDQFHSGGSEAVDRLCPSLQFAPGMTVLDIGFAVALTTGVVSVHRGSFILAT